MIRNVKMPLFRANECTKPEGYTLEMIQHYTDKLFAQFRIDFLELKTGIQSSTLRSQKTRRKLSQEAATLICEIPEVKAAGFTREQLRPDIQLWFDQK